MSKSALFLLQSNSWSLGNTYYFCLKGSLGYSLMFVPNTKVSQVLTLKRPNVKFYVVQKENKIAFSLNCKICDPICIPMWFLFSGACKCNGDFVGEDCSVNKNIPPALEEINGGHLCDINLKKCQSRVIISGSGFTDALKLVCIFSSIVSSCNKCCKEFSFQLYDCFVLYHSCIT